MSWKRFLLWSLLTLTLLAAGTIIWAWNTDLGRFQGRIETALSEALQRDVRFDSLSIKLGSVIKVRFEGLTLANPDWSAEPDLIRVGRLMGEMQLRPLIEKKLLILTRLEVDGARIDLRWNDAGVANFDLGLTSGTPDNAASVDPFRFLLRSARLTDLEVSISDPQRDLPILVRLDELVTNVVAEEMLALRLEGAANGFKMSYEGEIGPFDHLLNAKDVEFDGKLQVGDLTAEGMGLIDNLAAPNRPRLALKLEGSEIRNVEKILGLSPSVGGPFSVDINTRAVADNWFLEAAAASKGFRIDFRAETAGLQDLNRFDMDVHAKGDDLQNVLRLFGAGDWPSEYFEVLGDISRRGPVLSFQDVSMVIGETAFDLEGQINQFPHLRGSRLKLNIAGPNIAGFRKVFDLPGAAEGDFSLKLTLDPGPADVGLVDVKLQTNLGQVDLDGELSPADQYQGTVLNFDVQGTDANAVMSVFKVSGFPSQPFELRGAMEVKDKSLLLENVSLKGLYGIDAKVSGNAAFAFLEGGTDLDVILSGANIDHSLGEFGLSWPLAPSPFEFEGGLRFTPAGLRIDDLEATIGLSELKANALVPLVSDLSGLDITIQANGQDLSKLLEDLVSVDMPREAWSANAHLRRVGASFNLETLDIKVANTRLEGDVRLPWPLGPGSGDIDVDIRGPDLSRVLPRLGAYAPASLPYGLKVVASARDDIWRFENVRLDLNEASVTTAGTLDDFPDFSATQMKLTLDVPDLSELGSWNDQALPAVPLSIKTGLLGTLSSIQLDGLEGRLGRSTLNGGASLDFSKSVPRLEANLNSPLLDLAQFLPKPKDTPPPDRGDGKIIPDDPLPLEALQRINAKVLLNLDKVVLHDRTITNLEVDATLEDGALELRRYHASGILGKVETNGRLIPLPSGQAAIEMEARVEELVIDREEWRSADPATLPKINAQASITATGGTPRELAASLDGHIRIIATEGTLPGAGLGAINSYLLDQILSILLPGMNAKQPTQILCMATSLDINDGIITTAPAIAVRTDKLLIMSSGKVNLRKETLDLGFQTTPTKLFGASFAEIANPFVKIQGSMVKPEVAIDPAGTLVYGGAAAATAGLSILAKGLLDRIKSSTNPCEHLRTQIEEEYALEVRSRKNNTR